jgi:hypothetical protein
MALTGGTSASTPLRSEISLPVAIKGGLVVLVVCKWPRPICSSFLKVARGCVTDEIIARIAFFFRPIGESVQHFKVSVDITKTNNVSRLAAVLLPRESAIFYSDDNFPRQYHGKQWKTKHLNWGSSPALSVPCLIYCPIFLRRWHEAAAISVSFASSASLSRQYFAPLLPTSLFSSRA